MDTVEKHLFIGLLNLIIDNFCLSFETIFKFLKSFHSNQTKFFRFKTKETALKNNVSNVTFIT